MRFMTPRMSLLALTLFLLDTVYALPAAPIPPTLYSRVESMLAYPAELYPRIPSTTRMISPTLGNELAYRQGIALSFKSDIASQQQAFQTFKSLADSGISKAQMKTADAYRFGKGVPKDFTAALNYYRLAATDAQYLEIVSQKLSAMAKEGWVPSVSDYFRYTPPSNRRA